MDWLSNKNHLFCFLGTLCPLLSLLHCPYCPSRGGPCTTSATSKYRFFKAFLVHTIHLLPIHRIYDIHPSDMLKIEICCHFHFLFYFFNCSRRIDEDVIALISQTISHNNGEIVFNASPKAPPPKHLTYLS